MKKVSYISFDNSSKEFVLQSLGKGIDQDGYIIEIKTNKQVLTQDGEPMHIEDFGGVRKGSEIFFKKDLPSVLEAFERVASGGKM